MPIPADLQAAMTDSNMFSRLGAVSELRVRLLSDNLPSAVGAHEALAEIARTDIQYVAEPAKAALAEAVLRPSRTEIEFAPVPQGAEAPRQEVELQGPPIARAAIPHTDDAWIHLRESAESFVVTVETTTPGRRTGAITLKAPSGELTIPVTTTITPTPSTPEPAPSTPRPAPSLPKPAPTPPGPTPIAPRPTPSTPEPAPSTPKPQPTRPNPAPPASKPEPSTPEQAPSRPEPEPSTPEPRTPEPEPSTLATVGSTPTSAPARLGAGTVLWALLPVLSLGLLTPAPFIHAAGKLKAGAMTVTALIYSVAWIVLMAGLGAGVQVVPLYFVLMIIATVHAFSLRRQVFAPALSRPAEPPPAVRRQPTGPAKIPPQTAGTITRLAGAPPAPTPTPAPTPATATGPATATPATRLAGAPAPRRTAETAVDHTPPHFRVVALGVAGSGKTVYLSSMFHTVNVPAPGRTYFLETNAAHRVYLSKVFDEVSDTSEPWPRGTRTGETRELDFDCVSFDAGVRHTVFRISYLDYAGELLESEQEAGSTALADLESRIRSAHGLLCMLDGYRVLQYLRNEPAGRRYFRSQIQPMTGIMAGASCPIHFVLTKWDLVRGFGEPADADENTRLDLVRDALLETAHLRALIETHTFAHRVIRLIPVSAVGPHFAQMDQQGHVLKLPDGEVDPTNVEVPLTAILPDLFRQVESSLDALTRRRLTEEAASRRGRGDGSRTSLDGLLSLPAGMALRQRLQDVVGGSSGRDVMGMFLDWMAGATAEEVRASGRSRQENRMQAQSVEAARAQVLAEFADELDRLEARLPASRLSGR
ncbi:hypothetical protein [Kribbella sp. CA-294648]|uniref:hypothetical protein n=1 Tax=Kribbella sp. CA-294648 TaxID=3239948 RepID=UPI003D8B00C0